MPIATETIEATVYEALEQFGAEPSEFSRDAELAALDVDSLDLAELAQIIDEKYEVRIKGDDMKSITTVGDVIDFIAARV